MEGPINLPKSLIVYNIWVVPSRIDNSMKEKLLRVDQCLANIFVRNTEEAEAWLAEPLERLLLTGSLNKHIRYDEEGLPDGAVNHLLGIP